MFVVAAKAGLGFAVFLAILGGIQTHAITDSLMFFITVGLIPGTNLELPPELMLFAVAAALMWITVLLFRWYYAYHAVLDRVMPEYRYMRAADPGPAIRMSLPDFGRLAASGRAAAYMAIDTVVEVYFWLRSLRRPIIAQAITMRQGLTTAWVRLDRWSSSRKELVESVEALNALAHDISDKVYQLSHKARDLSDRAKSYIERLASR